jgi:hypothetical protein
MDIRRIADVLVPLTSPEVYELTPWLSPLITVIRKRQADEDVRGPAQCWPIKVRVGNRGYASSISLKPSKVASWVTASLWSP